MNRYFLAFSSFVFLLSTISGAAVYKGQKTFVKECLKCHTSGQNFVASKNMKDWEKLLDKKGKVLANIHLNDKNATKSWEYFKGSGFTKKARHLEDFLVEYAKDSGNAPACD